MLDFSKDNPCRCGFDGTGRHRCHAGRDPGYPGGQCENEARPRLVAIPSSLAGMQLKTGVALACYCDACHEQAFPRS
jgi:hypothetical protein